MDLVDGHTDPLGELLPPLSEHEASIEANRCLYCYDAPCIQACPTHIDIPRFIKKIATGNLIGSARTIFEENLLGATCARVCPVQELCEGACVLGADHKPISIGRLQRHAMDYAASRDINPIQPVAELTTSVAIIGSGPAGLACAGELRRFGHKVTIFEKRSLPGGLSTWGIIQLREPIDVALEEAEMIRRSGVDIRQGVELGVDLTIEELESQFDAVFVATGFGKTRDLGIPGEEHILDGLDVIEQSKNKTQTLSVGRNVSVIGGGNTAIDCATIAKRLGAQNVTILYRRTSHEMAAYDHEHDFAKLEGIAFRFLAQPVSVIATDGQVTALECVDIELGAKDDSGRPAPTQVAGSEFIWFTDQVMRAIGQHPSPVASLLGLKTRGGFIEVDDQFETSRAGVFAGGDCIRAQAEASTVMAVQDGKLAGRAIHARLEGANHGRS